MSNERGLVVTSHLYTLGGGATDAIQIAKQMNRFLPTVIATTTPISPQVRDLIPKEIKIIPFQDGIQPNFDVMFNICHNLFVSPAAKRNLARIFCPMKNRPPQGYELFAVSQYSANLTHELWGIPCEVLYPFVERKDGGANKKQVIFNVARFAHPNRDSDKGHLLMIEAYKAIVNSGRDDWQLVLAGSLEPGQEGFFSQVNAAARGFNIKLLPNAEPISVAKMYSEAAIYWHATGMGSSDIYSAQEHFGITTVEAMLAGCVPVTHGTGGQPEIVEHKYDGFLVKTAQELYDITMGLIASPSTWTILSQRAAISAERFSDPQFFSDSIKAVLEKESIKKPIRKNWLMSSISEENVSIIIPVHNQALFTMRCLQSLIKTCPKTEVVLVDNASGDETATEVKTLLEERGWKYVRREVNDGFSKSINYGKQFCTKPFILLLNNDTEAIQDHWLHILLGEMENGKVGIVGPKLIFPDNTIQFAGGYINWETGHGIHAHYREPDSVMASERKTHIEFITGACLLVRSELLQMDEELCLNGEDAALCIAVKQKGYEVVYQPGSVMIHYERMTKNSIQNSTELEEISSGMLIAKYGITGKEVGS